MLSFRALNECNVYVEAKFNSLSNFSTKFGFAFMLELYFCFVLLVLGQSDIGCFRILACISHVTIPEKDARGQHKAAKPAGAGGKKPQQAPLALGSGPCFRPTKIPQLAFRITHAFVALFHYIDRSLV